MRDELLVAVIQNICVAASWFRASRRPLTARDLVARAAELLAHHDAYGTSAEPPS